MGGILWLLVFGAFFYLMMRYGCGAHMVHGGHRGHGGQGGDTAHSEHRASGAGVTDPMCGMEVAPGSGYSKMLDGREYRFCSRKCLDQFDAQPAQYTRQKGGLL
jgi:YHS domain-containing protein